MRTTSARPLCAGRTRTGDACKRKAMKDGCYCASHAGRIGRPLLLDADRHDRLVKALKAGLYREQAAVVAGISRATFFRYLALGRQARRAQAHNEFCDLLDAVEVAEAEHAFLLAARVTAASATDWRAAAWMLERKFPTKYGKRNVEVARHEDDDEADILEGHQPIELTVDQREAISKVLLGVDERQRIIEGRAGE